MPLPTPALEPLVLTDYEGKTITLTPNGDPTRFGMYVEVDAGNAAATGYVAPAPLQHLRVWLDRAVTDVPVGAF